MEKPALRSSKKLQKISHLHFFFFLVGKISNLLKRTNSYCFIMSLDMSQESSEWEIEQASKRNKE